VQKLEELAAAKSVTPSQLALAWTVAVGKQPGRPAVIPIPGASKAAQIEENTKAVELSDDEFKEINDLVEGFETAGARYPDGFPVNV
jgi:pyridoxine 4-dehydrogenase